MAAMVERTGLEGLELEGLGLVAFSDISGTAFLRKTCFFKDNAGEDDGGWGHYHRVFAFSNSGPIAADT